MVTVHRSLLDCPNVAGTPGAGNLEAPLGFFDSGSRRKVAVVVTADGRRVHVPIEPERLDVSLLTSSLASGA